MVTRYKRATGWRIEYNSCSSSFVNWKSYHRIYHGAGSRVQLVPVKEQSIQGGKMSQFFQKNNVQNGDKFKVEIDE
ncbi:MAG: hypothetical protein AAF600_13865 [Bacteroidota bacterium]